MGIHTQYEGVAKNVYTIDLNLYYKRTNDTSIKLNLIKTRLIKISVKKKNVHSHNKVLETEI